MILRIKHPRSRMREWDVAVPAFWLILGLCECIWLGPSYAKVMRPPTNPRPDYFQDWASARNYRVGLPIYTPHSATIPMYLGRPQEERESDIEYNAHPPASVLLALPLAGLHLPDAMLAWNLVSLAASLASLAIIASTLPELKSLFLPAAVLLPVCLPVYSNFMEGQLTLVLVLLVTSAWALDRTGRSTAAGLLIGAAGAFKLFPIYLGVYFAARGRWRAVLAAAATFAALNLATGAVLGWETYRDYIRIVLPTLDKFRSYGFNLTFAGFCSHLFDPAGEHGRITPLWPCPAAVRYGTLLSDLIATAFVASLARRAKTTTARDLAFGATVTAMLLVSPVTWDYSLPLLLVPLAVITRSAEEYRWMPVLLALIFATLWLSQGQLRDLFLAVRSIPVTSPAYVLGPLSIKFYALLAVFVPGLAAFRAAGQSGPRHEGAES